VIVSDQDGGSHAPADHASCMISEGENNAGGKVDIHSEMMREVIADLLEAKLLLVMATITSDAHRQYNCATAKVQDF